MRTYKTSQGETWDEIAGRVYGSGKYTGALLTANQKYTGYLTFPYGIELSIPEIDETAETVAVPWKKVEG